MILLEMTTHTSASDKCEKLLQIQFFTNFWL